MPAKGWRQPDSYISPALLRLLSPYQRAKGRAPEKLGCVIRTRSAREIFDERVQDTLIELCERRQRKGRIRVKDMPEQHAIALAKLPERVAAIVGKTFSVIGSDAFDRGLADDQAIAMIKDLLDELDEGIIERNQNKSLARLRRVS